MARLKKGAIVGISIASVIIALIIVFIGILFGTNLIQSAIIDFMCQDKPGSTPADYENILAITELETFEYKSGLELDVIEPKHLDKDAVTVLVFHGGYYLAGGRHNQEPYARLMATKGYRVVNVSYTLGKAEPYPRQLQDACDALNFVANKYADSKGFVVSGDSAGAHLASSLAALVTSEEIRNMAEISEVISSDKLLGVIGNCGFYEASSLADSGFFLAGNALEILLDDKNYLEGETIKLMDVVDFVDNYPPTLLVCGDKDKMISQAEIMENALKNANRDVFTYFPVSQENELGHEFQCNYNFEESYIAMEKIEEFLAQLI